METWIIKILRIIYQSIKEILCPSKEICFSCREKSDSEVSLCKECISKLKYVSTVQELKVKPCGFIRCHSVTFYCGIIKDMILRLKYKGDFEAGEALAFLMYMKLQKINMNIDVVTYVPMFRKDEKRRGYNQSHYLAKEISRLGSLNTKKLLIKIKSTKDQIGLSSEERNENIKGCFKAVNLKHIENKSILLIDDVFTTGSTVSEAAKILKKAKCKEIIVLTVAKSTI